MNGGIINSITRLHLVGYFSRVKRVHVSVIGFSQMYLGKKRIRDIELFIGGGGGLL
jgi:hypothetical protein